MEIKKEFDLSLKDYMKFNIVFTKMSRNIIVYFAVMALIILVIMGYKDNFSGLGTNAFWLKWLLYFGIAAIFLAGYFFLLIYLSTKKVYKANIANFKDLNLTISPKGLSQTLKNGTINNVEWKDLSKITSGLGLYIFLINKNQGVIVNKSVYSEAENMQIKEYINHAKINKG